MNCPKCNHPLSNTARFCGACGQAITAASAPEPAVSAATGAGGGAATAATWSPPSASVPAMPGFLDRAKNILLSPRTEWPVIAVEATPTAQLFIGYVAPLAALAALVAFIHLSLLGVSLPFGGAMRTPMISGLTTAAMMLVFGFLAVFLLGLIVNGLAPTFGGTRDMRQALKVAAYSMTPAYVGTVLALSPILSMLLQLIAGCYGIYVMNLGLPIVMRSPKDRAFGYTATVVICTFLLGIVFTVASVALGIAGHASGLMGSNEVSDQQGTQAVGDVIGGALGTNAQGKAGIAAALNNLVKAGEQQQRNEAASGAAATTAAPTDSPAAATSASAGGAAQNPASAVGGLMGALGGALGGDHPHAAVDFRQLTPALPASLSGMKRIDATGSSQSAMGVKTASATASYQGDNGTGVKIEITDMTAMAGIMGMAGALVQDTTSESASGFEKDQTVDGHVAHEKFDANAKHGVLTVMLAKRFQVEITGDGVDMGVLEKALGSVDLSHLESMKDAGATPQ